MVPSNTLSFARTAPQAAALTVLVTGAAATDLASGRIYNIWTCPALIAGILCRTADGTPGGLLQSLSSIAVAVVLSLAVHIFGGISGGDVKLIAAVAAFYSPEETIRFLLAALFLSGAQALIVLAAARGKKHSLPLSLPLGAAVVLHLIGIF